jgi:hypothetical protein
MFPRLRDRLGTALDIVVELSTLGEYRLAGPCPPGGAGAPPRSLSPGPCLGGAGSVARGTAARSAVAEGVTGAPPVSTPAARAQRARGNRPATVRGRASHRRPGATAPPEQLCLAL